jgi:RNA polymerase sigma factor for flagellar operon FliA
MIPQPHREDEASTRDATICRYLPLVRCIARLLVRSKPPHVEFEDMVSWGVEGLLGAYGRYDPERRASFKTYASFRIRGTILDRIRSEDHLPRTMRRKAILIERARERLTFALQREPSEEELARSLHMDLAALRAAAGENGRVISMEDLDGGHRARADEGASPPELPDYESDPHLRSLLRERATLVTDAVARLTAAEQETMRLYYGKDLTMREVASTMGISESRVSQLHAQGIVRLRALLTARCEEACP